MLRIDSRFLFLTMLSATVVFGGHQGLTSNRPLKGELPIIMINDNRGSAGDYGSYCMRDDILGHTQIQYNRYMVVNRATINNYRNGYTATYTPTCGELTRESVG